MNTKKVTVKQMKEMQRKAAERRRAAAEAAERKLGFPVLTDEGTSLEDELAQLRSNWDKLEGKQ